ncbi:MAG: NYN domain-containing protein [Ignavibacteriales bacterium]|nr:MAG: NYN domain-containing protein [Ignavibacteriales bacterium]
MKTYIIDGNNLIGKSKQLANLQKKDGEASREKLVNIINNYFHDKNHKVFIHFDGFESSPLNSTKSKIVYSDSKEADHKIKEQIEHTQNKKNVIVVTSDSNLQQFAKVCRCEYLSSENFLQSIYADKTDDEETRRKEIDDNDEFKRLFGV